MTALAVNVSPPPTTTEPTTIDLAPDGSDIFRYDSSAQQYIYNLGTKPDPSGSYALYAHLDDGTYHGVDVGLK